MSSNNIEVGVVREDKKFQVLTPQQIKEYLDELNWCWIDHYHKIIYKILKTFNPQFLLLLDLPHLNTQKCEQRNHLDQEEWV